MLSQDELVLKTMSQAGQVSISPEDLDYDADLVRRDFFIPIVREYQAYRPNIKEIPMTISTSEGSTPPRDFRKIVTLTPYSGTGVSLEKRLPKTAYEFRDGFIIVDSGDYILKYFATYTITYRIFLQEVYSPINEDEFFVDLRQALKPETLIIRVGGDEATSDGAGVITGDFTGTYNLETWRLSLVFPQPVNNLVLLDYTSVNPIVLELDLEENLFMDLFASKLLASFGTSKSIVRIDGLPFDITVDGLMDYGRQKEEQFTTALETRQTWWSW